MKPGDPKLKLLYAYTKALSVALGYRDQLTRLHSERVRDLCAGIGIRCGLNEKQLDALRIAASFHDIGKIGIPDHILLKPSAFTKAEWEEMKRHAEIGAEIIASIEIDGAHDAAVVIRHHHEHFDGSGYPDGLKGERIPICSRIISIADSYDAMAVTRTYHHAKSHPQVMDVMYEETGKKHDPELMNIFCDVIESGDFPLARSDQRSAPI
ncbi:MAG: HD domain-containing protein [Nitrosomonadales bacterium]|nr:HD domain-containing protein [Nitrosomonadales bacterium]